jgi:hypothetical protein
MVKMGFLLFALETCVPSFSKLTCAWSPGDTRTCGPEAALFQRQKLTTDTTAKKAPEVREPTKDNDRSTVDKNCSTHMGQGWSSSKKGPGLRWAGSPSTNSTLH